MQTLWLSPTDYVTGDASLQLSYPSMSHPNTIVTSTTTGDLKWISIGLPLPANTKIEEVVVCYQVSNSRSFISQVRLTEMNTPNQAMVICDDTTDLQSINPVCYSSLVGGTFTSTNAAITLALRLNFQDINDTIMLGAIGVKIVSPPTQGYPTFNSVEEMKAAGIPTVPYALLAGYYTPGDGGGSMMYWDATADAPDNGGTIFAVNANTTGRWKRLTEEDVVWAEWFGAKGDGIHDDQPALQAALNSFRERISDTNPYLRGGVLKLRSGRKYRICQPLILIGYPIVTTIEGERRAYVVEEAPTIFVDYWDKPGIIVHVGRNVSFRNFFLEGRNLVEYIQHIDQLLDDRSFVVTDSNTGKPLPRTNRYSPYCGIAFDPFDDGIAPEDRYPGLNDYYDGYLSGTHSVIIEQMTIAGFYVGVMINSSMKNAQGDSFTIEKCFFDRNTYCVAIGQSQSRNVHLRDNLYNNARTIVNTYTFGRRTGDPPYIDGGQATSIKYLFEVHTANGEAAGDFHCQNLYGEGNLSLGFIGFNASISNTPASFRSCYFTFGHRDTDSDERPVNGRRIDFLGQISSSVKFDSCLLVHYDKGFDFLTHGEYSIVFDNCKLVSDEAASDQFISINIPGGLIFRNCDFFAADSGVFSISQSLFKLNERHQIAQAFEAGANRLIVMPGTTILVGTTLYQVQSYESPVLSLGNQHNLTFDAQGATLNVPDYASPNLKVGDMVQWESHLAVYEGEAAYNRGIVGRISEIQGTKVTLRDVPHSLNNAQSNLRADYLRVSWLRRFHLPTTGSITAGFNQITNVSNPTAWTVGDRIQSRDGIPDGTHITAIDGNTFTLSTKATATKSTAQLYDAPYVVVNTTETM